ncbi:MAG: phosphatase PAP2 family protein [Bacteroidales bacterium]|nr:phosphatase PAP2 family protein [Bacteroidales bacterium]
MIETLNNFDTQLFYLINGHHCTAMDWVMWVFTARWSWIIVIVAAFCFSTLRHEPRKWWIVLAGIALCFLLADQGSVQLFKNTVCRLRPCHALPDVHMFREGCGGLYGFISSHAANAFAIATFFCLRYWKRDKIVPVCMIVWACLTSYSRAYLGKHYPGDLICGALFGILVGIVILQVISWIEKKLHKRETKS